MNWILLVTLAWLAGAAAQRPPELLFREDWKEIPAEIPLGQNHVANPDLRVALYGPGFAGVKKSHHDWIENDPFYVWSGACPGNWAVTLRPSAGTMNLAGSAKVRWRSRQSGFRELRVIVKLSDGTWLVSDRSDGPSDDWHEFELDLGRVRWRKLNIERVSEEEWIESPDLSSVSEIGFSDLMSGGLTPASSRLDWIEVFGRR